MAQISFIQFFDKKGEDYNFSPYDSDFGKTFEGAIYFPRVSTGLIESNNIFLLQEVTLPSAEPTRRRLTGNVITIGGNPTVNVTNGKVESELIIDDKISINDKIFTVTSTSENSFTVSPTPSDDISTENFYLLDYLAYNEVLTSPGLESESLVAEFENETSNFFFYDVYQENIPLISKNRIQDIELPVGPTLQDTTTGRIMVSSSTQIVNPIQLNMGFMSEEEGIFDDTLILSLKKSILFSDWFNEPVNNGDGTWSININYIGYLAELQSLNSKLFLRREITNGSQYFELKILSITENSTYTSIIVKETGSNILSTISNSNLSSFSINLKWKEKLLTALLYAEAEAEDERFRLVLENFGRKIDEENEYIFRDSDVNEELTDFSLLNKKRKELLLEGNKIYPYMGSYKALINVLNLFGYNDIEIKEYFLNVDSTSLDKGKLISVPIAKSSEQNKIVKQAWKVLPSKVFKKTSLFGLFYKLNTETGSMDEFNIPLVEDSYQFTIEEILIKLFGLKELLKKEYLPLNARIYDITGEGIYFDRYNIATWSDQVNIHVVDIGKIPDVVTYPAGETYIRDLRYIDDYYKTHFITQGLTGFLGPTSSNPGLTSTNTVLESIYSNSVNSFEEYLQGKWEHRDQFWDSMPPSITDPLFNVNASYMKQLPDDENATSGAPILSELIITFKWDEAQFSWDQCSVISNFTATYSSTGLTATITDLASTIYARGFTGGSIVTISNSEIAGSYPISNISGNDFDITLKELPTFNFGNLSYSRDISTVPVSTDRLSWDSLGQGEYIDMRITAELTGARSFRFDSGRTQIEKFKVDYYNDELGESYKRILFPLVLPFTGIYDIGVYIYDMTNNVTMQFIQKEVKTPTAQITAAYQLQHIYDNFDDMTIKWKDAAFDWYYPAQAFTKWENANLNWDSLELIDKSQQIYEDKKLVDILSIDRSLESVLIQDDITDIVKTGDFLYFTRDADSILIENEIIQIGDITRINSTDFKIIFNNTLDVQLYSKLLLKKTNTLFNEITTDEILYVDVIAINLNTSELTLRGYDVAIDNFEAYNTSNILYWDAGLYTGTYAIEILSFKVVSGNTLIYLKDTQKELYKLDGYFQPYLTKYDVDFAEMHIGNDAENYENSNDTTWNSLNEKSWWSKERHNVLNSGFLITEVAPGSSISISSFDDFFFSGDSMLNDKGYTAMNIALSELRSSSNEGINHFEYNIVPIEPVIITELNTGNNILMYSPASPGDTSILVNHVPWELKVPATISVTQIGPSISVSLLFGGCGYDLPPTITFSGGGGTGASVDCTLDSLGSVTSITYNGGTGYVSLPTWIVSAPTGHIENLNDHIWTGSEWKKVIEVDLTSVPGAVRLNLEDNISYPIDINTPLYLPTPWHQTQYMSSPKLLNDFYVAIQAVSKTPSLGELDSVIFNNGTAGEWFDHPYRSYSYPLGNSLLFKSLGENFMDANYKYWENNGFDFPVIGSNEDDSRALYAGAYTQGFAYADINITDNVFKIPRATTVLFTDDTSRLPAKRTRLWKIIDAKTDIEILASTSDKLVWKFTKIGEFTIELTITDKYGNESYVRKHSLIEVF
jgi:hypothetical protein